MIYLFDVLPTLGRLCGIPATPASDGIEFTAAVKDPSLPARHSQVFAYKQVQRAINDGRWKVIRYPQVDRTQLFDLQTDPDESINLAEEPAQLPRVNELLGLLEKELRLSGDTAKLKVANPKPAAWSPPVGIGKAVQKAG